MFSVKDSFKNLIKLCRFSKTGSDNRRAPEQQVEYLGKVVDAIVAMPYGSHANVPEDFMAVLLQLSTQEQNRILLPLSLTERPHPIASGEVVYYHPITGDKIHFKNNGDIDITTKADVNINCANANVNATTKVNVTAPNVEITGNVKITGKVNIIGATSITGGLSVDTMAASGSVSGAGVTDTNTNVTVGTHTHNGGAVPAPDAGS